MDLRSETPPVPPRRRQDSNAGLCYASNVTRSLAVAPLSLLVWVHAAAATAGSPWYQERTEHCLAGNIGGAEIHLILSPGVDESTSYPLGVYVYDRVQKPLELEGMVSDDGSFTFYERTRSGVRTGEWHGKFGGDPQQGAGRWTEPGAKRSVPLAFRVVDRAACKRVAAARKKPDHTQGPINVTFRMLSGNHRGSTGGNNTFKYPLLEGCLDPRICTGINSWLKAKVAEAFCDAGDSNVDAEIIYADRGVLSIVALVETSCAGALHPAGGRLGWVFDLATGDPVDWGKEIAKNSGWGLKLGQVVRRAIEEGYPLTRAGDAKGPCAGAMEIPDVLVPVADGILAREFYPSAAKVCDDGFQVLIPYSQLVGIAPPGTVLAKLADGRGQ
jgi:hypothetical protein